LTSLPFHKAPTYFFILALLAGLSSGCAKDILTPKSPVVEQPLAILPAELPEAALISAAFPTMAWIGVPQSETSISRYQEMNEAGINHSFSLFSDADAMQKALDVAQLTGVKMFVSCPELGSQPEITVRRFMKHPALAGYYLADEPSVTQFRIYADLAQRISTIDPIHPCYVNLLPSFAELQQLGTVNYGQYVDKFINQVPVGMLSFDNYPIIGNTSLSIRPEWYNNLEVFSAKAKAAKKPFWAFALTVAHSPYPVPTLAALRLQVYSNLAYGAQGIQYFTYWTLSDPGGYDFHNAPISLDGKKTDVYEVLKTMNKEINALSGVFLGAKISSVTHTGLTIPNGTKRFSILPESVSELKTDGLGALVSIFKNGNYDYLMVVNRDFTQSMALHIKCKPGMRMVLKDGSSVFCSTQIENIQVQPGDLALYRWTYQIP
jgi:hypothetical protein